MISKRSKPESIEEYMAEFPAEVRIQLEKVWAAVKGAAPKAENAISYGIPTLKMNGNLVHFAAFKNHIGFFPTSSGIRNFKTELARYECSKGTVRFPIGKPMPLSLIRKIVKFRVKENELKKSSHKIKKNRLAHN